MKMLARYGLAAAAVVLLLLCLRVLLQLPPLDDGDRGTSARRATLAWGQKGQGGQRDLERRHDGVVRNNPLLTGEMGRGVVLAPEEKARGDAALRKYNVNVLASDLISLNRQVPDSRPTGCESLHYPTDLPSTAVVIPFHNEWPSVLLRTVHSIISRTPPSLLKQIILVDDASDLATLKEELDLYLQEHFPENLVQVVRLPQRAGLIRARLEGFRHVTTEVVSFFDSHMEVNVDWLQPLLVEIKRDRRTVAMGHLDYIQPDTFQYSYVPEYHTRYGFDWRLVFFETYFLKSQERGKTVSDPLPGVVMVGPAFAINSDYFREIGTYDSGMKIWGGENLELAWRVWLCGGRLVHLPCSKIGHIARPQPYTFPDGRYETEIHNYKRAVEVWMGPYKRFVYEHHPRMKELDVGDLTERLLLKKRLGCRNFSWFLKNVWPELYPYNDNATHWGGVTHLSETLCLDNGEFLFVGPEPLRTKRCNFNSFSQGFSLTTDRRLRTTLQCVGVQEEGEDMVPVLITCNDDVVHTWIYTPDKQLKHDQTGLCLQLMQGPKLVMQVCRNGDDSQVWEFREQGDPTSIADLEVDQAQRHRERSATLQTKSPVQMLYELEQQMRNMSLNLHQPVLKEFTALAAGHIRRNFDSPEGEGQKINAAPGNGQRPEIPAVHGAVVHDEPITRDLIFTPKGHDWEKGLPLQHLQPGELLRAKEEDVMRWTGSKWTTAGSRRSKKGVAGNMVAVNRRRQRTPQPVLQVHVKRQPDHRVRKPRLARIGDDIVDQDVR